MMMRTTLNGLQPRTLRDATRDPWDCGIEGPYRRSAPLVSEWVMGAGFVAFLLLLIAGAL